MDSYSAGFYEECSAGSKRSAQAVVPLIIDWLRPNSVVDVGCGTGTWLSVFWESGVHDILGIDGEWVDRAKLDVPDTCFQPADVTKPLQIGRRFDLVVSVEVAEHLPAEHAAGFIDSLTSLGPVVLFSAAIPGQGGTHHVNEQWPEYWAALFRARGFIVVDCLRKRLWQRDDIDWWYAQNSVLCVRRDYWTSHPSLRAACGELETPILPLVHPRRFAAALSLGHLASLPTVQNAKVACGLGWDHFHRQQYRQARALFFQGIQLAPFFWKNWVCLAASFLPQSLLSQLRRLKRGMASERLE